MSLRCKPGDIAVIIGGGFIENIGRMVRVLGPCHPLDSTLRGADWDVELLQTTKVDTMFSETEAPPGCVAACADCILRPIRDGEGEDETLTWADKPVEVPA